MSQFFGCRLPDARLNPRFDVYPLSVLLTVVETCPHLLTLDLRGSFVVHRIAGPIKEENPVIELCMRLHILSILIVTALELRATMIWLRYLLPSTTQILSL